MNKLEKKIEKEISEYIGFNINKIINDDIDVCHIFGGAIRDIIADKKIHDIDILCLFESMRLLEDVLIQEGYKLHKSLTSADIQSMYSEIHVVIEPKTYIKIIDEEIRIIQLIRPGNSKMHRQNYLKKEAQASITNLYYLLGQVDMSNCAVHYSKQFGLRESYYGAVKHCKLGVYEVLETEMKSSRFHMRVSKFRERGWKNLSVITPEQLIRMKKIKFLIDEDKTNYYLPTPGPLIKKYENEIRDLDGMLF